MAKKFHRLAGWSQQLDHLPQPEQDRTRDFIFTHVLLGVSTMKQLQSVRESYTAPDAIKEYGEAYCAAALLMIDGYIALRTMRLTRNVSYLRRKRRRRKDGN